MIRLLHITAHLGGGVGKVLSQLVEQSSHTEQEIAHTIVCLEAPEKMQFAAPIQARGTELLICPPPSVLAKRIDDADIVQVEWWHHPAVAAWLGHGRLPAMRLVVWSHVSGLHIPALTPAFVTAPARFIFSSPCSAKAPQLQGLNATDWQRTGTVFSSGGFDDLPPPPERPNDGSLRTGYVGTLNPAKLHPAFLDFVAAVERPDFRIELIGDPAPGASLLADARQRGLDMRLNFQGYRTDIAIALSELDILAYPLNPLHYGTTENALLEAMAMGVVPIVLDHPAERCLVDHGQTGLIVRNPTEFAEAIRFLETHPQDRHDLSAQAAQTIRQRFSIDNTHRNLLTHYATVMTEPKREYNFAPIFGTSPADWFRSCQGDQAYRFHDDGSVDLSGDLPHALRENSKGSVSHFARSFPEDIRLRHWSNTFTSAP